MNKVTLAGRLGQDPDLRFTQGGGGVLNLRLATTERFKDAEGEWMDRTEWHTVVLFGKRAESLSKIIGKGDFIVVDGRLQTRSWEDKQGQKRYSTEVVANDIELTGGKRRGGDSDGDGGDREPPLRAPYGGSMGDDDIPFAPVPGWVL